MDYQAADGGGRATAPGGRRRDQRGSDTLAEDGDPLDAMVLVEDPVFPRCWVSARPIGIFWTEDEKGPDAKIICVPLGDPRWDQVRRRCSGTCK